MNRARRPERTRSTGRAARVRSGSAAEGASRRRNRKPIWVTAAVVLVVVAIAVAAWVTPVLSARSVSVVGNVGVSSDEVLTALAIPVGTPLLQVDTGAAASRVASIAKVDHARVERRYPSTIRVTVVERAPAVFFDAPEGTHLMDASGVAYAIEPPPSGVPRLAVPTPGRDDPATIDALAALTSLPPQLRTQVTEVSAGTLADIHLTLADGREVVWGSVEGSAHKAAIVLPLLGQPGRVFDVSSPDLPTVR
ncbi:cell division protein FtsQ/DivIB [Rhodococcus sp. NPDC003318]|uniref:cell division protein FtsQ/DivIB n=1 Tax=Rhodococcus sp. NPDC003318 TaxID=3364503 RepID=UPI003690AB6A